MGVFIRVNNHRLICPSRILPDANSGSIGVIIDIVTKILNGLDLLSSGTIGVCNDTSPNIVWGVRSTNEGLEIQSCYDTEVSGTTFEGLVEVWVRSVVGVDDCSVCEDDLDIG